MMVPEQWEPFRAELRGATLRNIEHARAGRLALLMHHVGLSAATHEQAARVAASWLHAKAPYKFDASLAPCDASECMRRGFSACADAAALAAAVALICGATDVDAIVRAAPAYAHVVLLIGGVEVDPYAFRALPAAASSEAARWSLSQDVGLSPRHSD
jgi:hypothetical protein